MPERIKIVSFNHKEGIFLLKVGDEEFFGSGDCYLNRKNGKPFPFDDVELLGRVERLEKWAKLS